MSMDPGGLDDRASLVHKITEALANGDDPDVADDSPMPAVQANLNMADVLEAVKSRTFRKLQRARWMDRSDPQVDIYDLPLRDFIPMADEVKTVVDILSGVTGIDFDFVKQATHRGALDEFPPALRPPAGAIPCNHFTDVVMLPRGAGRTDVIKATTFEPKGKQGEVKGSLAHRYGHPVKEPTESPAGGAYRASSACGDRPSRDL